MRLVESFARHLMVQFDAWQEFGFAEVAKNYLARLAPEKGVRRDIDENGDLVMRRTGKAEVERRRLVPALAAPSWLDPADAGARVEAPPHHPARSVRHLRVRAARPSPANGR